MKNLDDFIRRFPSLEKSQIVSDQCMNQIIGGSECTTLHKVKCKGGGGVNPLPEPTDPTPTDPTPTDPTPAPPEPPTLPPPPITTTT